MADTPERRPTDTAPAAERAQRAAAASAEAGGGNGSGGSDARRMAEEARQRGREALEQQKRRGMSMLDQQKGKAADQLKSIASALHQTASECARHEERQTAGKVLEQAASSLEKAAESLRSADLEELMDQATRMVRRQPAMFIGGAIAAGFLISRFLKSSEHHYEGEGSHAYRSGYGGQGMPHVTSAHSDPDEILPGRAMPPVTPTGRRDY